MSNSLIPKVAVVGVGLAVALAAGGCASSGATRSERAASYVKSNPAASMPPTAQPPARNSEAVEGAEAEARRQRELVTAFEMRLHVIANPNGYPQGYFALPGIPCVKEEGRQECPCSVLQVLLSETLVHDYQSDGETVTNASEDAGAIIDASEPSNKAACLRAAAAAVSAVA